MESEEMPAPVSMLRVEFDLVERTETMGGGRE